MRYEEEKDKEEEEIRNEEILLFKKKAKFYKDRNKPIHIKTKKGFIYNGFIKEEGADFIILNDRIDGEIPIFFLEMVKIEEFKQKENNE